MSALDIQFGGDHYKGRAIQPVAYIHSNGLGYCEGNVVKYVTRWKAKGGLQDLEKAKHYIELLMELEKVGTSAQPPTEPKPASQCQSCGEQITGLACPCQMTAATSGYETVAPVADDYADEFYQWGGAKWMIHHSTVFTWNALIQEWQESTLLPEHLRRDGRRLDA